MHFLAGWTHNNIFFSGKFNKTHNKVNFGSQQETQTQQEIYLKLVYKTCVAVNNPKPIVSYRL